MRSHLLRTLALSLLTLLIMTSAGCVTGTRSISIPEPNFVMTNAVSAGSISIGEMVDRRRFEEGSSDPARPSVKGGLDRTTPEQRARLIGRQRNGYGKAIGDIDLPGERTVQDEVRDLLASAFAGRGYAPSNSSANRVDVEIQKFWAWFQPGMWVISFNAEIRTKLRLTTPERTLEITVEGSGINKGQVASDRNWALAYQRAYDDYLQQLETALQEAGL